MKKILIIAAVLIGSITAKGQQIFPSIDSLQRYINIHIRNSAINAFTNLRLNTALIGTSQFLGTGSGGNNTNIGSGFRLLNPGTQTLRTFGNGLYIIWDTATTGQLKANIDTASMPKTVFVDSSGITIRYGAPSGPGVPDTLVFSSFGGSGPTEGYGTNVTGSSVIVDTGEIASKFSVTDSFRVAYDLVNSKALQLMSVNDSIVFSGGPSILRIPTNGNVLIVAEGRSNPIDFTSANLYYWIWNGRVATFMGRLFPTGYIDESEEAAASLYLAPNGTIQIIFAGYQSDSDNSFYRSELTVNPSTNVITPSASPTLLKTFTTFALLNNHRVLRASTGRYYLPYSIFISGTTTSLNDASSVYNGKLMVSDDGMTWRETSTTIYSPDSLVAEPGIYESDVTLSDPKGSSTGKLVYYYRNRRATANPPGTIYYTEANLANDTTYSQYLAMGIDVPNSPLAVINYKKRLYAIHNKWMTNATTQDEVRKEMVISVGHEGEQVLNTRIRVAGNEVDSMATTAPIIWVDSVTNNIFAFYTDIQQVSGRGAFWMKRFDIDVTEPPTQDRITTVSSLDVVAGASISTGSQREYIRLYPKTAGFAPGYITLGNGVSSQYNFLPQLTFKTSTAMGAYGTYFKSFVGSDAFSSMYSGAFVFDGFTPGGGTLTAAPIATFISNGNQKFAIWHDGRLALASIAGDAASPVNGQFWYNSSTNKFRAHQGGFTVDMIGGGGGGTYTFQHSLTETGGTVNLVNDNATPGAYKLYGSNGSSAKGWHSINLDYNSDVNITSPQADQALVYFPGTTNWRNAYVIRPGASSLTSGVIPIASGDRTIDNSLLVYDGGTSTFDFGTGKIALHNSFSLTGGGITTILSWDGGGIVGTTSNHILELWANGAKRAQLNQNGTLNYAADYTASMSTDRHIPDIGKVNSLITADVSPYATYVLVTDKTFSGTTAEVVTFDTEINEAGITHLTGTNPEEITFATAGVYTISFDAHVFSTATDNIKFSIQMWDGDSWEFMSNSAALGKVSVANNTNSVTLSYQSYFSASSKIRIVAAATTTNCTLNAIAADANGSEVPAARIVIKGHKAVAP
jgi:hypothetical protein